MTGASGSFYSRVNNYNLEGYLTLTVKWKQIFTSDADRSVVEIEAFLARDNSGNPAGGTWFANSTGGISVNGTKVCGWNRNQAAVLTLPGQIGWSGNGSTEILHTDAEEIAISIDGVTWNNTTYNNSSFSIPSKTQTVMLSAVPKAYTLSIDAGAGAIVTVNRTVSILGASVAAIGNLVDGARIYEGDKLQISFAAIADYAIGEHTVNGKTFISGNTHTVSSDVIVAATAYLLASNIGATDANIGSVSTITIAKYNPNYCHSLQFSFGSLNGFIASSGSVQDSEEKFDAQSVSFTVPASFYEEIPNAKTGVCTIICRTYSSKDSAAILGEPSVCTFVVTATGEPGITGTVIDTNLTTTALTGDPQKLIRYRSRPKCTVTATPKNSATISDIKIKGISVAGITDDNGITTAEKSYPNASYTSFDFSATDSRGYVSSMILAPTVVSYVELTCTPVISRPTPTGGSIVMSASGSMYRGSFGAASNTLTLEYRYKTTGGTYGLWETIDPSNIILGSSKYTVTNLSLGEDFDYRKSYVFQIRARDGATVDGTEHTLSTVTKTVDVQKGVPIFDWGENDFNVNVALMLSNVNILDIMYPVGAVYMHSSDTLPDVVSNTGTWSNIATEIDGVYAWKRTA